MKNYRILSILLALLLVISLFSGCNAAGSASNTAPPLNAQKATVNEPVVQESSFTAEAYPVDLQYKEFIELLISEEPAEKSEQEPELVPEESVPERLPENEGPETDPSVNPDENTTPTDPTAVPQENTTPTDPTVAPAQTMSFTAMLTQVFEEEDGEINVPSQQENGEEEANIVVFRDKKVSHENGANYYHFQIHVRENDETVIFHGTMYPEEIVRWEWEEEGADLIKAELEKILLNEQEWIPCQQEGVYAHNQVLSRSLVLGETVIYTNTDATVFQIQTYKDGYLCDVVELSKEYPQMLLDGMVSPILWKDDRYPEMQFESMEVILPDNTDLEQQMIAYEDYIKDLMGKTAEAEQRVQMLYMVAAALVVTNLICLALLVFRKKRTAKRKKPISKPEAVQQGADKVRNFGIVHNIGSRSGQQDSFDVINCSAGTLAVVADGMGGLSDGDKVSQKIVATMRADSTRIRPGKTDKVLCQMVAHANLEVNRMLGASRQYKCGSTLLAVLVEDGTMQWVTVGDSRIYLYRGGKLIQINREHIYCAELLEHAINGKIGFADAMRDPQVDRLSSFVGMGELKHVDICLNRLSLCEGDHILLMSDGVFNTLTDDEIADVIKTAPNAAEAANIMEAKVLQKKVPNQDNFTCVILEI